MSHTALLVIDVQESFRHAPYWDEADVAPFTRRLQSLIDGAAAQRIPVLQVFHTAPAGPFSRASGHVRTLEPIAIQPDAVFHKSKHSALVGTGLDVWLTQHGIRRVIVVRHPHRAVLRDHRPARLRPRLDGRFRHRGDADVRDDPSRRPPLRRRRDQVADGTGAGRAVRPHRDGGRRARPGPARRGVASVGRRIPVLVVLPPRALLLDLAGPLEVLRVANDAQQAVAFDVAYTAPQPATRCSVGLVLSGADPLPAAVEDGAVVLVPGSSRAAPTAHHAQDEAAIVAWLGAVVRPGHTLVTVCDGALLAARAGLLDGYACTTHHASCARLAAAAPRARVLEDRLFVEDRDRFSSAGVTAGVDLMLHLVARWAGPGAALAAARTLVVYMRRGPNDPQLSPWLEGRSHLHPAVHRAQDAIAAEPARDWSLAALGRAAGASPRHLSRLFQAHAGMTVTDAVNRSRVALARELVERTDLAMEQVAERAGFGSARQMRRVWGRFHPTPPSRARA